MYLFLESLVRGHAESFAPSVGVGTTCQGFAEVAGWPRFALIARAGFGSSINFCLFASRFSLVYLLFVPPLSLVLIVVARCPFICR